MPPVSRLTSSLLRLAVLGALLGTALPAHAQSAQCGPNMPSNTVCGRLGAGQSGPPQAIPFASLFLQFTGAANPNTVLAGPPSGVASALATYRALVGADLPLPTSSTLGGIEAVTCPTHQVISAVPSTQTQPTCGQLGFSDLTGSATTAQMAAANPGTTGNGGISAAAAHVNVLRNSSLSAWFHGCVSGACTHTTTAATSNYSAEGVFVLPTGANVTSQATTTCPANNPAYYCDKITGASSNTDIKVRFVVESYTAAKIAGLATTFQFTFINNSGATITPALSTKYPTTQDGGVTSGAAWGASTADLAATNLTACTNGSTCLEAYTLTANASATNGYEFVVDFGAMNSNADSITIGAGFDARATPGISTGINTTPPAPEVFAPSVDIAWCQRFFNSTFGNTVSLATASHNGIVEVTDDLNGTFVIQKSIRFPAEMRAAPTIAFWDGAGNSGKISSLSITANTTSFTDNQSNGGNGAFDIGAAGFIAGYNASSTSGIYFIHYTADASLWGG